METINYGISKNYLSHWGVKEALREIVQNFLDFGKYEVDVKSHRIVISSDFNPQDLEFLAIGNSFKDGESIGKYGEGLKMALLILTREGIKVRVDTQTQIISPIFMDTSIGETLAINIEDHKTPIDKFLIRIDIDSTIWNEFYDTVIQDEDVIFELPSYGQVVDKPAGNIYCGRLFVCHLKNMSKAYNVNVGQLPLDRDRSAPMSWDVNWATSKINEAQGKMKIKELSYSDSSMVSKLPDRVKAQLRPRLVGNSIEVTYKDEDDNDVVVTNSSIKEAVMKDSFFKRMISKLRVHLMNRLGLYDMLIEFEKKHLYGEAKRDFKLILDKAKGDQ